MKRTFKCTLLVGSAVSGVALGLNSFMTSPVLALACTGQNTVTVTCAAVNTTTDMERTSTNTASTTVTISGGNTGLGFQIVTTVAGANITATNSGTISATNAANKTTGTAALELQAAKNGNISYMETAASGVGISSTNEGALLLQTSGTGTIAIGGMVNGGLSGTYTANSSFVGITAITASGSQTINLGTATISGSTGLLAKSSVAGSIEIDGGLGGSISGSSTIKTDGSTGYGIFAASTGGNGTVDINYQGKIVSGVGIYAEGSGNGSVTVVTGGGTIESTAKTGGWGIQTVAVNGPTTVTIGSGGLTGTGGGVYANSTGTGNIEIKPTAGTIDVDGVAIKTQTVSGSTLITIGQGNIFGDAGGVIASSTSGPIVIRGTGGPSGTITSKDGVAVSATTGDAGTIQIKDLTGNISGGMTGVSATAAGGSINISNLTGTIVGATDGIVATNTGAGVINITTANTVKGTSGDGIRTTAADGTTTIILGGNVTAGGSGVYASSANGDISVTGKADITAGKSGTGVVAVSNGSGDVTVAVNGVISGGAGIVARTGATATPGTTDGVVNVTTYNNVTGTSAQGILTQSDTGNTTITLANGFTVTGATNGIQSSTYSGDISILGGSNIIGGKSSAGISASSTGGGDIDITKLTGSVLGGQDGMVLSTTGSGTITVITQNTVTGTSGDGIRTSTATGATTITLGTYKVLGGTNGIVASSTTGSITITGTGDVEASKGGNGDGVQVSSQGGAITIGLKGTILGDDEGIAATNTGAGTITVNTYNTGTGTKGDGIQTSAETGATTITLGAFNVLGGDNGIVSKSTTGAITISGAGNVEGTASNGVEADSKGGAIDIGLKGTILGGTNGITATNTGAGTITVNTYNTVIGTKGDGIQTSAETGATTITLGAFKVLGGNNGIVSTSTTGNITISGLGAVEGTGGNGVQANSKGGAIDIGLKNTILGGTNGIVATSTGAGTITINTFETVTGTKGDGIQTSAETGATIITLGSYNVLGGKNGIVASSTTGNITISGTGAVEGTSGNGVQANSQGGAMDIGLKNTILGKDFGITATNTGSGTILINTYDNVTATAGTGIYAEAVNGLITINAGAANNVDTISATNVGIDALSKGTGGIAITNYDTIPGTAKIGIQAVSMGASGNVTVTNYGLLGSSVTPIETGIIATATSGTGAVLVNSYANIFASKMGIQATSLNGNSTVNIDPGITITGNNGIGVENTSNGSGTVTTNVGVNGGADFIVTLGKNSTGLITGSATGNVNVNVGSSAYISAQDASSLGVSVTGGNNIVVNNYGVIEGGGNSGSQAGAIEIKASTTSGTINNYSGGTIQTYVGNVYDLTIKAQGAAITINNNGYLRGNVDLTNNGDVVNNNLGGLWDVNGKSSFGAGFDTVNNSGTVQTAFLGGTSETAEFFQLDLWNNNSTGLLSMQDQARGSGNQNFDTVTITGVFHGNNGRLAIDTYLGAPGSGSDLLETSDQGGTSGLTRVVVKDINLGPGAYNPTGIAFVTALNGDTQLGQFVLDSGSDHYDASRGVLDKGMFFYDIATRAENGQARSQVLIGMPDREVFEMPRAITGAQTIWHETAGVWLDRQADLRRQLMGVQVAAPAPAVHKGYDEPAPIPLLAQMGSGAITPGVWAKAVGSWTNRSDTASVSALDRSYRFNMNYSQDVYGLLAGVDFGTRGMANQNDAFVFGALAGYVQSNLDFKGSPNSFDYKGATVGLYATYLNNGFYVDVLAKADLLNTKWKAPSLAGFADVTSQSGDANSYGGRIDTGYRFAINPSVFIEPTATLAYVRTDFDTVSIPGGNVNFADGKSLRSAVGLRVGTSFNINTSNIVEASITGRIWNEFEANNRVTVTNLGPSFTAYDNFDGAFGEVVGLLNFFNAGTGWSGFANVVVKFNNDFTTTTARAGVRHVWGTAPAPVAVAAPAPIAVRY